jgi:hypothetical protein
MHLGKGETLPMKDNNKAKSAVGHGKLSYLSSAIVGTMAEVGVGRPTARARARALVLESAEIISQVRALMQTNL